MEKSSSQLLTNEINIFSNISIKIEVLMNLFLKNEEEICTLLGSSK
jgi:hypothetical protein